MLAILDRMKLAKIALSLDSDNIVYIATAAAAVGKLSPGVLDSTDRHVALHSRLEALAANNAFSPQHMLTLIRMYPFGMQPNSRLFGTLVAALGSSINDFTGSHVSILVDGCVQNRISLDLLDEVLKSRLNEDGFLSSLTGAECAKILCGFAAQGFQYEQLYNELFSKLLVARIQTEGPQMLSTLSTGRCVELLWSMSSTTAGILSTNDLRVFEAELVTADFCPGRALSSGLKTRESRLIAKKTPMPVPSGPAIE